MAFSRVQRWDPSPWCMPVPPCSCSLVYLLPRGAGGRAQGDVHGGAGGKVPAVPLCFWQEDVTKNWQVHTLYH